MKEFEKEVVEDLGICAGQQLDSLRLGQEAKLRKVPGNASVLCHGRGRLRVC